MLSKCANPECNTPLHYLREGKVFKIEKEGPFLMTGRKPVTSVEHFWLCGPCAHKATLTYDAQAGVKIEPKTPALAKRAAAS